jgi:hypothetical protein
MNNDALRPDQQRASDAATDLLMFRITSTLSYPRASARVQGAVSEAEVKRILKFPARAELVRENFGMWALPWLGPRTD